MPEQPQATDLVWNMYADENDDKLVNGAAGFSNTKQTWGDHGKEPPG